MSSVELKFMSHEQFDSELEPVGQHIGRRSKFLGYPALQVLPTQDQTSELGWGLRRAEGRLQLVHKLIELIRSS
ncbi:hypothetical protein P4U43_06400 [Arthrobacter sp. EH-1B-1]|uniref:Uncharacterized protein n=1 Tax=Arthrobacter vasquezii TaxID=2977629 RepID=A0ABT6CVA2_9MICC|nr:hypothetical protein [Arthrobacter vasquezii]MDF9277422.1 hypothetical protein [Arthrobacter vasquezii]